jgi:hypothetical protein
MDGTKLPVHPGVCPYPIAVKAWNIMGGLDWNALPIVFEILGVDDPETVINQLVTIRENGRNS